MAERLIEAGYGFIVPVPAGEQDLADLVHGFCRGYGLVDGVKGFIADYDTARQTSLSEDARGLGVYSMQVHYGGGTRAFCDYSTNEGFDPSTVESISNSFFASKVDAVMLHPVIDENAGIFMRTLTERNVGVIVSADVSPAVSTLTASEMWSLFFAEAVDLGIHNFAVSGDNTKQFDALCDQLGRELDEYTLLASFASRRSLRDALNITDNLQVVIDIGVEEDGIMDDDLSLPVSFAWAQLAMGEAQLRRIKS